VCTVSGEKRLTSSTEGRRGAERGTPSTPEVREWD